MKILTINLLLILLSYSSTAAEVEIFNGSNIPDYIIIEIQNIAMESNQYKIEISSKTRTVKKQVEVMLDYYIDCDKIIHEANKCGVDLARKVYDLECHGGFSAYDASASRNDNIEKMTHALTRSLLQLGDSRRCMNHVVIPGTYSQNIAIDIKPSSISNRKKFYQAIINNENVVRFYYPEIQGVAKSEVRDAAFHLEFKRKKQE